MAESTFLQQMVEVILNLNKLKSFIYEQFQNRVIKIFNFCTAIFLKTCELQRKFQKQRRKIINVTYTFKYGSYVQLNYHDFHGISISRIDAIKKIICLDFNHDIESQYSYGQVSTWISTPSSFKKQEIL